jgi:hypothetical protein
VPAEVVVLSYGFWQRRFAGDPTIVGRAIRLNAGNTTVVGVMPRDFEYPLFWGNVDIWRPFAASAPQRQDRGNNFLREFGRLKPGVTPEQAEAAMRAINQQILDENTNLDRSGGMRIEALNLVNPVIRRVSVFAFGLTFLVLLIACVNLANLQLARTAARAREFAIRGAIGGGKGRLLRQSLTDSLVLSVVGGAIAIPLSSGARGSSRHSSSRTCRAFASCSNRRRSSSPLGARCSPASSSALCPRGSHRAPTSTTSSSKTRRA